MTVPTVEADAAVSLADNPGGMPIEHLVAEVPPGIAALGAYARWRVVTVSTTGATVWSLEVPDREPVFLKVAPAASGAADRLRAEAERVRWLHEVISGHGEGAIEVPAVVASEEDPATGDHYLALTSVRGTPVAQSDARGDAEALLRVLAEGLRWFHGLPVGPDAHVSSIDDRLGIAARRVSDGLVDRRELEPIYARYEPAQLYQHLVGLRPPDPEDLVVVHGEPTLDNTLLDQGRVSGYVDLGRAAVSDRYVDLAIVARELATRVSPHALGPFFDAYGLAAPDLRKVEFYLLLDELS